MPQADEIDPAPSFTEFRMQIMKMNIEQVITELGPRMPAGRAGSPEHLGWK